MSARRWLRGCDRSLVPLAVHLLLLLPQLSEVKVRGLVSSAVLSPLSHCTALLTVLQPGVTQHDPLLAAETNGPAEIGDSADLPDVVSSVLGVVYDIMEEDGDGEEGEETAMRSWVVVLDHTLSGQNTGSTTVLFFIHLDQTEDHLLPEWARQEVSLCPRPNEVLEAWFPQSDQSGVSSHLMESMR